MKITIPESEWNKVQPLIFDDKGKYFPEIIDIQTGWMQPFWVYIFDEEAKVFCSILDEMKIKYRKEN